MTPPSSATALRVESAVFPPSFHPPGTTNTLFLGGAGARGIEIQGNFVKVTAIGIYLEDKAIPSLAVKWKGYNVAELTDSVDFYRDIVTGPFEKFAQVTMILPLTGKQFSEKVSENCVAIWKTLGMYTEAEATAVDKFKDVFKDENFPPDSSILFTISPSGSLTISFSKNNTIPEYVSASAVIENQKLAHAILESMIGKHGVSPEAKLSLASRLSNLMKQHGIDEDEAINKTIHDKPNASVEHEAIK